MLSKISTKVKFVSGILSLSIIVIVVLTVLLNEKSEKDSLIINIAGKQRMLTQKMSKEIFYIKSQEFFDFRILDSDIEDFGKSLNLLLNGDESIGIYTPPTPEIDKKLKEVQAIWQPFKKKIEDLKRCSVETRKDKEVMMERIKNLLLVSDTIVKRMVGETLSGHYIDLSGRQRMLSQKMGLYLVRYLRTGSKKEYYNFNSAKNLYSKTITQFINDKNIKKHPGLYKMVEENYALWKEFSKYMASLIKKEEDINSYVSYIYENNTKLLNTMDEAVWLYTEYSEDKSRFIKNFQYIMGVIALIVIFYSFLISKEVGDHIEEFVKKAKNLAISAVNSGKKSEKLDICCEDDLKEASDHINTFVDKVNNALKFSDDAISRADFAAEELQVIADELENALDGLSKEEKTKLGIDKNLDNTEDIAIESTENLMNVSKMLFKLKENLNNIRDSYQKNIEESKS